MPHANRSLPPCFTASRRIELPIVLCATALLIACGADETADSAQTPPAVTAGQTTGTLTLGDRTFEFNVAMCDLSDAEAESPDEMLRGGGTMEDGTRFSIILDRQRGGNHSVSLYSGTPPTGFFAEARNGIDATGADEPIISIDGQTVRASGTFDVDDAGEETKVEGNLEATCPAA